MKRHLTGLAGIILALVVLGTAASAEVDTVSEWIRSALQQRPQLVLDQNDPPLSETALQQFYAERDDLPAWITATGLHPAAAILTARLAAAAEEGLCPEPYHLAEIEKLAEDAEDTRRHHLLEDRQSLARLDLLLSESFFTFAAHLIHGRVDPASVYGDWRPQLRDVDLAKLLAYALDEDRLDTILKDLAPPHPDYRRLREALAAYRRISALGGWGILPDGATLRPGDVDSRVVALRQRLSRSGDLEDPASDRGERFDPQTVRGLRHFQRRHGLLPDGILGPQTLRELNCPVEERIRQLEVNLERWRWLPKTLGDRYLKVNIADLTLSAVDHGHTILSMPVVVGNSYRQTPVFSARLQYLIFAPYWYVPPTIFKVDKFPLLKNNPGYLEAHHYDIVTFDGSEAVIPPESIPWKKIRAEAFPGTLRQSPGPWNPLGRVKFIFPNPFSVYLHDTPDRHLFAREMRTFSSGCIRIERPADLAQLLLKEQREGDCAFILDAMAAGAPRQVNLLRPWPIHILYFTAWVDEGGTVQFRPDLYWRDLALDEALNAIRPPPLELPPEPAAPKREQPLFSEILH